MNDTLFGLIALGLMLLLYVMAVRYIFSILPGIIDDEFESSKDE